MAKTPNPTHPQVSKTAPKKQNYDFHLGYSIYFVILCATLTYISLNQQKLAKLREDAQRFERLPVSNAFKLDFQKLIDDAKWTLKFRVPYIEGVRANLTKIKCIEDVPDSLMAKWKPDPSRFIGVETYLYKRGYYGTANETLHRTGTPVFEASSDNKMVLKLVAENGGLKGKEITLNKDCDYISQWKFIKVHIKDGDLYITQKYGKTKKFTLVYSISASDLI